ncbi:MAG: dihydroorotase [Acidobacteria bacterium]|nr:dihydroorotase [Acidobacteriota bacterium]MBU2437869.1 dihydroorotase [Acidobacteriota bacterium]
MRLLLKNGRVIDPVSGRDETLDLLIEKGKIVECKPQIKTTDARVMDVSRKVVLPGLIDMHVHLREPGQEYKETIQSGGTAAARGGFTAVACMPNTKPVNDRRDVTEFIRTEARRHSPVHVFPIAAITLNLEGENLTDMAELKKAGAVAFSDDGHSVVDSQVMRRAMEYARMNDLLLIDHCEDPNLTASGVMHEGAVSYAIGLRGIPSAGEEVIVARDITLAGHFNARLHIAHLSTAGSADMVRAAKKQGIAITAEVTPHHVLLSDNHLRGYDTNYKMSPPLRGESDIKALIKAVQDGTIDVFATDHAPHSPDDKEMEFDYAPFGIIGLESAVPLLLDRFVHSGLISLQRFAEMLSSNPARILGLEGKGRIEPGADADLTVLNLSKKHTIDVSAFASKGRNCPFNGWTVLGQPEITIVGGRVVYEAV